MNTKRMYLEGEDFSPLINWLKTQPQGNCSVIIASAEPPLQKLTAQLRNEDRELVLWIIEKIRLGELDIRTIPDRITFLPIGRVIDIQ